MKYLALAGLLCLGGCRITAHTGVGANKLCGPPEGGPYVTSVVRGADGRSELVCTSTPLSQP
jgi:hypothetical protein